MTMTATERSRITSLLGADADSLLSYTSKFVNKSTLLPQRGPQGAAVRPVLDPAQQRR